MDRRKFLELAGLSLGNNFISPGLARGLGALSSPTLSAMPSQKAPISYGSGHFGEWVYDAFGLPAYKYTCDQTQDPKAISKTEKAWRSPTDHSHQIGNDRIIAVASNYGYIQVRQDEGSPKFLNDYSPEDNRYGAGLGFLTDEEEQLSTYYSNATPAFERTFGTGYFRKQVNGHKHSIDQLIFAPFGDDPVLISQVTITNLTAKPSNPRWIEYWGCSNYQFSYRALMEAAILGDAANVAHLRRDFAAQFTHRFTLRTDHKGLIETQSFRGRTQAEEDSWQRVQASLKANPNGFYGGPTPPVEPGANTEDIHPPATFLVSLDAPVDGFATNGAEFFAGSIKHPQGMRDRLSSNLNASGPESAFLLERQIALQPHESRTIYFLYGYLPQGYALDELVSRYAANPSSLFSHSSQQWKSSALVFRTEDEPWVERETIWSSYYLRSGLTYDSFFREHILSQGGGYQYVAGLQGAARDPLQHVLPFLFSNPAIVREVIRYTLKETQPDGSLPYGIVGNGVPMPCRYRPSDLELWLLWLTAEYLLATRDKAFLEERIPAYPKIQAHPDDPTIATMLEHAYTRITTKIGSGPHGLMRLRNGDWNDSIVVNRLSPTQVADAVEHSESVLNAAMAGYVFDRYAAMLEFIQQDDSARDPRSRAEAQRQAVRKQWNGQWFRRAWLGEELGWCGEKQLWLEPQPWALLGGAVTAEQQQVLLASIEEKIRKPSPIGALLQSQPDETMKDEPGVGTNGGVFPAINGTLIWALARINGAAAWDEWKKNSLARHAEIYPNMWFGIWSGPDTYNSVLSKNPGETEPNFPVMNMHSHAWPLYTAAMLLGLEFNANGLHLRPMLPLTDYEFSSSLLGFTRSHQGYSGWYAPIASGSWSITILLPRTEIEQLHQVEINGVSSALVPVDGLIQLHGQSTPGAPLFWKIS